jgi:cytochrome b subunit of formate dehydrogenase
MGALGFLLSFDWHLYRYKGGDEMEERSEASASIWVWVVILAIAAALVAGVVIFLKP